MAKIVDSSQPTITITLVGDECYGLMHLLDEGTSFGALQDLKLQSLYQELFALQFHNSGAFAGFKTVARLNDKD